MSDADDHPVAPAVVIDALRIIYAAQQDPRLDWKLKNQRGRIDRHLRDCERCSQAYVRALKKGRISAPEKLCAVGKELISELGRIAQEYAPT